MPTIIRVTICLVLLAATSFGSALEMLQKPRPYYLAQEQEEFPNDKKGNDKAKPRTVDQKKPVDQTDQRKSQSVQTSGKKKSMWKAAGLSALLPGMGQRYLGHQTKARVFFAVEAGSWISFASFRIYSHLKKEDMINYAAIYAHAQLDGKSDGFLDLVGFYRDINSYNTFGRVFDTERPYLEDTPSNHWYWSDTTAQATFRQLKNASREAHRRAQFALGVAIVNRIVSVIDAVRDARRLERRLDNEFGDTKTPRLKLAFDPLSDTRQVNLTLFTGF